jgi:DNA-binding NarL/FixJ family response regulator
MRPNIVILDIRPVRTASSCSRASACAIPICRCSFDPCTTIPLCGTALRAGACGYIMKEEATEKVLVAIRRLLVGEIYLSDRLANKMPHQFVVGAAAVKHSPLADLTNRGRFRMIGRGSPDTPNR